ncbi:zinc transporter ZupT [Bacteroides heparinolyticus]|uniref:zinc transporter ZupT n=1 Tax=Prevotella heparinolytica TaxID=28113 RepID=UPI0035A0D1EC
MSQQVFIAFLLTLFAGVSTGIGSAIAFFAKRTNTSFLSLSLGFSAGVMIYVSFAELFVSSVRTLVNIHGKTDGTLYSTLSFFGGIVLILLIDKLIPLYENPHEMHRVEEMSLEEERKTEIKPQLLRVGVVTALVLAIHNFPEGMVTFLAALKDINIAIPIAFAIAIHNIPEGISVSVPVYYATGNRKRAFWLSFLSGLAEPVGAIIGYLILAPFLNDHVFGVIFGMIAGIMVFISLDELLPAAEEYGKHHHAIYGLVAGMAVMAISLLMLG